ncbi:MAG: hypothetical protein NTW19_11475 [Planctomycetota bacterium]|nr:hypothetical protein [Planctomycetota bacterium]
MTSPSTSGSSLPGFTPRSVAASLLCMLLMGMHLQMVEVLLADSSAEAEHALPLPAMLVFVGLLLLAGGVWWLARVAVLSRQEMLCVLFSMLIAAPIMTQGMWHRFVGLISATPRYGHFDYIDTLNDKLWPHGPNLTAGALDQSNTAALAIQGDITWAGLKTDKGEISTPFIRHGKASQVSTISLKVPVAAEGKPGIVPGEPYLISFLAKPESAGSDFKYFCRVYYDETENFQGLIETSENSRVTFIHKDGTVRAGVYGVRFKNPAGGQVRLELGLKGAGTLALTDLKLLSVAALEGAYTGRKIVSAETYAQLPVEERAGLIVRPKSYLSVEGLKFLLQGYIPFSDWAQTLLSWSTLVLLILAGTLSVNVLMRKHWAQSERYPYPMFRIPAELLGGDHAGSAPIFSAIWKNGWMWGGLAASLAWCLARGWHFYNPAVPDLDVKVNFGDYISDPVWGETWKISFTVSAIYLSIAIFMELNILISLVIGFVGYRLMHWLGEASGLNAYNGYPFRYQQSIGAYLGYALVVVLLARRHITWVVRSAIKGDKAAWAGEAMSYRAALLLLIAAPVGAALWAHWLEVPVMGIVLFFLFLVLLGFVAAKFRAECGLPTGYFTPYNAMLFVSLLGGMAAFGADGMMTCLIASGFLTVSVFFFIPGAQAELIEFGRRFNVTPRHLVYTSLFGAVGGLVIGAWVFLSNAYALGGDSMKYAWAFRQDWFFSAYRGEISTATGQYLRAASGQTESVGVTPSTWIYLIWGVGAAFFAVARQLFPGFWFHPIGFILGSSHMVEGAWGSLLVAWVVRGLVLKLGGAMTLRTKVMPMAVGMFLGALASLVFFNVLSAYMLSRGVPTTYGALP